MNHKVPSKTHLAPYNFKPLFVQFHPPNKRKLPYFLPRRHNSHCEGVIFFPQPLRQPTGQDTVAPTTCKCTTKSETHTLAQLGAGPNLPQNSANLKRTRSRKLTRRAADIPVQMWWTAHAVRSRPNVSLNLTEIWPKNLHISVKSFSKFLISDQSEWEN